MEAEASYTVLCLLNKPIQPAIQSAREKRLATPGTEELLKERLKFERGI